jgi:nitrogen-specific signal transduction histidine kinase
MSITLMETRRGSDGYQRLLDDGATHTRTKSDGDPSSPRAATSRSSQPQAVLDVIRNAAKAIQKSKAA